MEYSFLLQNSLLYTGITLLCSHLPYNWPVCFSKSPSIGKRERATDLLALTHSAPPSPSHFCLSQNCTITKSQPKCNPEAPTSQASNFLILHCCSLGKVSILGCKETLFIYLHIPELSRTSPKGGVWASQMRVYTHSKSLLPTRWEMRLHHCQLCVSKPNGGHLAPGMDTPSLNNFKRKDGPDSFTEGICLISILGSCRSQRISCWPHHFNE